MEFVTDRGCNLVKSLVNYTRHNSAPHFITNTVNASVTAERPAKELAVCQAIVTAVKIEGKNGLFEPSLELAVKLRWTSASAMFTSMLQN